jgi:hypothetical protein
MLNPFALTDPVSALKQESSEAVLMKKYLLTVAALCLIPLTCLGATDITVSGKTSAFVFNAQGIPDPAKQRWGFDASIEDQLTDALSGKIRFDNDPENGNTLSARANYRTSYLEISAGPSFGILNSSSSGGIANRGRPDRVGLGKRLAPGSVVASADTDLRCLRPRRRPD